MPRHAGILHWAIAGALRNNRGLRSFVTGVTLFFLSPKVWWWRPATGAPMCLGRSLGHYGMQPLPSPLSYCVSTHPRLDDVDTLTKFGAWPSKHPEDGPASTSVHKAGRSSASKWPLRHMPYLLSSLMLSFVGAVCHLLFPPDSLFILDNLQMSDIDIVSI
jgi:hypothetical protein